MLHALRTLSLRAGSTSPRKSFYARVHLEQLEDRVVPSVDAGLDQTIFEGVTAQFAGSISDPTNVTAIEWDFDYDGPFEADATGTLTPSQQYLTSGIHYVALRVTYASGESEIDGLVVTCDNVAPQGVVSVSGPTLEGAAVLFTVGDVTDPDPTDTFRYAADWTGNGQFEYISNDELIFNPDGSVSFLHTYHDNNGASAYPAVIRVIDSDLGFTDYAQAVEVTNVAPSTGSFGPSGMGVTTIGPGVPMSFRSPTDPSHADMVAGLTYWHRVSEVIDPGPDEVVILGEWVSSSSPDFLLPNYTPGKLYRIDGYVEDKDHGKSATVTLDINVVAADLIFWNQGDGDVLVNGVFLPGGWYFNFGNSDASLNVILLESDASYHLRTNGSFSQISAGGGVTGVVLNVFTDDTVGPSPMAPWRFRGTGDIGTINIPAGGQYGPSRLVVRSRGDLDTITGPGFTGPTGAIAIALTPGGEYMTSLFFRNLTGSITGLDYISGIMASGWLGDSISDQVTSNTGIYSLSAYGVPATVDADMNYIPGHFSLAATIGDGGISGVLEAGNLRYAAVRGDVNEFRAQFLDGTFVLNGPVTAELLAFTGSNVPATIEGQDAKVKLLEFGINENKVDKIDFDEIVKIVAKGSLEVTGDIRAKSIASIEVTGDLKANNIIATSGPISSIVVNGKLTVAKNIKALNGDMTIDVQGDMFVGQRVVLEAAKLETKPKLDVDVFTGNLTASFIVLGGSVTSIRVWNGSFKLPNLQPDEYFGNNAPLQNGLVYSTGPIWYISVKGDIGHLDLDQNPVGYIRGGVPRADMPSIGLSAAVLEVWSHSGNISANILAVNGSIGLVEATGGSINGQIKTEGGDIMTVSAVSLKGNIIATRLNRAADNRGGNIREVTSKSDLPKEIRADNFINRIRVIGFNGNITNVTIVAQAGIVFVRDLANHDLVDYEATFDGAPTKPDAGTLRIEVGAATFMGKVLLSYFPDGETNVNEDYMARFRDGQALLEVTYKNTLVTFRLNGEQGYKVYKHSATFEWKGTQFDSDGKFLVLRATKAGVDLSKWKITREPATGR